MSAMVCPHCESHSTFTVKWRTPGWAVAYSGRAYDGALQCHNPHCTRAIGAIVGPNDDLREWWPKHVGGKEFPDVPELVAATANEAHECASIGAYRGAVALARAVVESIAKEKGIDKGVLQKK